MRLYKTLMRILGVCPFTLRRSTWISKILSILLLGTLITNSVYVGLGLTFFAPFDLNLFEKHLEMATYISPCFFYGSILYTHVSKLESWNRIFSNLREFDHICSNYKCQYGRKMHGLLKIVFINLIMLANIILATYLWISADPYTPLVNKITTGAANHFFYLYQFNTAGFFWELCNVLESRYFHVKKRVQTIMVKRKLIRNDDSEAELREIIRLYKLLYYCTENLSNIFGMTIFFSLISFTAFFLENVYWAINLYKNEGKIEFMFIQILYLHAFMVSNFFLN